MTTSTHATLQAETREGHGKGAARALRRAGKVPAVVYTGGKAPMSIALGYNELFLQYKKGRFNSRLLNLDVAGKTIRALPQDVQTHPVSDQIEHVDFILVEKNSELRVRVPVKFLNQEKCAGIKRGGVLNIVRHDIEFFCNPDAIPEQVEIDTIDLNIGDSVHIEDMKLPEGIRPTIKRNFTVATIAGRASADEEVKTEGTAAAAAPGAAAPAAKAAAAKAPAKK